MTESSDPWLGTFIFRAEAAPRLSGNDESRLATLAHAGDRSAESALLEAHLRLVLALARRYDGHGTYATWWVRQAITRGLADGGDGAGVREPRRPLPSSDSVTATASGT